MFMRNTPDVIVLCGGAGLRLRSVTGNSPKAMATVSGRPFMELLLRQLERNELPAGDPGRWISEGDDQIVLRRTIWKPGTYLFR